MALNKYKLGDLITQRKERYDDTDIPIKGVSREGLIEPKQKDADISLYKLFYYNDFVFNPARMEVNSIVLNQTYKKATCSSLYEIFYVSRTDILLPKFLNMIVKRDEFARKCAFLSNGSAREYFRIGDLNELEIELPSITIQQKYVDIYKTMVENQKIYESRLDDLKLVCDGYIEDLRKKIPCEGIGKYIEEINEKNSDGKINNPLGISVEGFIPPKQDTGDLTKYNVFKYNNFVYSPPRINIGSIGLYKGADEALCSPIYVVFKSSDENKLFPEYLMMWLKRKEFLRSTDFYSIGSVRNNFAFEQMCEVSIPIPDITVQKSIAEIFKVLETRKEINEKLKDQIKDICPVLIQGALKEGRK